MMLIVRVELHHAVTGEVSELGTLSICNDATSDRRPEFGNYDADLRAVLQNGGTLVIPAVRVENHDRSQHVWKLVQAVLNAALRGQP